MKGKMIIVSAPSGAGKTTIVKHILSQDLKLEFSISATSRPKREGEIHGKDYYFLTKEEFHSKISNDEFVEWEEVYEGRYYGTLKDEVKRIWGEGNNVIFDVDVKGGISIKKLFPEESLAIFIQPPSVEELKNRLVNRSTDSIKDIQIRVDKATYEMTFVNEFDLYIINNILEEACIKAVDEIQNFLNN